MEGQDVHPEAVLLTAEMIGNLSSLQMPFNVQNLLGNWLMLVGQIIITFNAQQQYWQSGPGLYYGQTDGQQPACPAEDSWAEQCMVLEEKLFYLEQKVEQLQQRQT